MIIMYRILRLILLAFVGFTEHVDSLVLTSSPVTATDGELFTLICSSNTTGGQDRLWSRDGNLLFITTRGSTSYSVSNPGVFNRYLSGRVSVSCDATQHNVTLRINSTIDNGSRWQCVDLMISPRSNTLTIYLAPTTTVSPTTTHTTPVSTVSTTTTTTTTSPSASTIPPGSLVLTSFPMTATDGALFTLICSSNTTGGQERQWSRDGTSPVFTTIRGSTSYSVSNNDVFNRYLSGRVNVSCDATQHNVTLRISSTIDNGSRWMCADYAISQWSNTLTIYSAPATTVSPTTTHSTQGSTVSTTTTATTSSPSTSAVPPGDTSMSISTSSVTTPYECPACVTSPGGVVAGTVGGAVLGSVITVVVVALWMHKRNKYKDGQTPNEYASTSAYEDVDHQYTMAPRQYVNTVQGTETSDYENTGEGTGDTVYYNTTQ